MAYCFARVWTTADIPLDEVAERYRVEIVSDGVVQRAIEVSEAAGLYAASDEVADFGSPQTTLAIRVRQLGRAVPLGIAASAVLSV
ncbi:hypothetical protein [Agrobacterium rosae]|uniref:hypothetical protein n=1 Tax=Agrobacterium rosae TaxID=1972867 RepID=UPI0011AFA3AF|nr:hypothetical protein [Agrobacterium rosae]